ncbi:hypothetical protein DFH09DRAFT_1302175 [Mycena vulgaris]|nr:hypothetical protein DFH09DRAFT_1302175 [Mycena vulgaris]
MPGRHQMLFMMPSFPPLPLPHSCLLLTRAVRPCSRLLNHAAAATSGCHDDARISPAPPWRSPLSAIKSTAAHLGLEGLAECAIASAHEASRTSTFSSRSDPGMPLLQATLRPSSSDLAGNVRLHRPSTRMSPDLALYEDIVSVQRPNPCPHHPPLGHIAKAIDVSF